MTIKSLCTSFHHLQQFDNGVVERFVLFLYCGVACLALIHHPSNWRPKAPISSKLSILARAAVSQAIFHDLHQVLRVNNAADSDIHGRVHQNITNK
jgi:hypothetical protein